MGEDTYFYPEALSLVEGGVGLAGGGEEPDTLLYQHICRAASWWSEPKHPVLQHSQQTH